MLYRATSLGGARRRTVSVELVARCAFCADVLGDVLFATTMARPMEMRGRKMHGWLRVDDDLGNHNVPIVSGSAKISP